MYQRGVNSSPRHRLQRGKQVNNIFANVRTRPATGDCPCRSCGPAATGDAGGSALGLGIGIIAVLVLAFIPSKGR